MESWADAMDFYSQASNVPIWSRCRGMILFTVMRSWAGSSSLAVMKAEQALLRRVEPLLSGELLWRPCCRLLG